MTRALTPGGARVLTVMSRGHTAADAGAILGISEETVKTHLRETRRRLRARSTAHAVAIALVRGEIHT